MRKLSEYKDEEALDLLADIMEPAAEIMADENIKNAFQSGAKVLSIAKIMLKNHKRTVMDILAALDGVPAEEYHCSVVTVPAKLIQLLNDKELIQGFTSQAQELKQSTVSGPVMGTIEGDGQ